MDKDEEYKMILLTELLEQVTKYNKLFHNDTESKLYIGFKVTDDFARHYTQISMLEDKFATVITSKNYVFKNRHGSSGKITHGER
jgi:hypothetical protein